MNFNGVKKYIKIKFEDDIYEAICSYFEKNRYLVRQILNFKCHSDDLEPGEIYIKSIIIFDKPDNTFGFDLIVTLNILGNERKGWDVDCIDKDLWLNVIANGSLNNKFDDFKVVSINPYNEDRDRYLRPLNDRLAPFMQKKDLDTIAEEFLKKYYPVALENPINVDVKEVANKMGLKIFKHNIASDNSVFGRIFFNDTLAEFYNSNSKKMEKLRVKAKSIVYDPDAYFMDNIENENNNTIIHECIHYEFHRHVIEFQREFNSKASMIECNVNGNTDEAIVDIQSLEWQANALAPRILMPYKTFAEEARKIINIFSSGNNCNSLYIMPDVIDYLHKKFHVSKVSVKIRLCDIGIYEAMGCNIWCDGELIPPHSFEYGTCDYNETFCIPFIDAICITIANPDLFKLFNEGKLLYIDSHLCLNNDEFLFSLPSGEKKIKTEYINKLNLFCIKLRMEADAYNPLYEKECFLNRDKNSKIKTTLSYHGMMDKMTEKARTLEILKEESEFSKAFFDLTNDFVSCMKMLKERSGMTYEDLEAETTIEKTSIINICSGKRNGSLLRLTLILMALGAEPDVAFHIIDKSGVRIDMTNQDHLLCRFIINCMHADSMDNILKKIKSVNMKI